MKSSQTAVDAEVQQLVGDDKESGAILNALTKQPSVLNNISDLEPTVSLVKDYVYKSIDKDNSKITCLDSDFNDITFDLDASNKDLLVKLDTLIVEGQNKKM
eukprot:TRINITY_DN4471_c0_g1_i1.p1 TRINITY_DN4471_c0_g1~~TRINITY_DN4471_c0_g1_i1.p1  ORF type:complete len:102 (+),score=29.64 TRINITY_DN4471_c0_g1_i1:179-484(+)